MTVPSFLRKRGRQSRKRRGISELYASLLMIGVTLSFGGLTAAQALNQFNMASGSASLGSSLQQSYAGKEVSLVYATVTPSGSCPSYQGMSEGNTLTIALFDYGTSSLTPSMFIVNTTLVQGSFTALLPGSLATYSISLGVCAHPAGQTILVTDAFGTEAQFET